MRGSVRQRNRDRTEGREREAAKRQTVRGRRKNADRASSSALLCPPPSSSSLSPTTGVPSLPSFPVLSDNCNGDCLGCLHDFNLTIRPIHPPNSLVAPSWNWARVFPLNTHGFKLFTHNVNIFTTTDRRVEKVRNEGEEGMGRKINPLNQVGQSGAGGRDNLLDGI